MKIYREVLNPTHGVLKKRITEQHLALISKISGQIQKVGNKIWTPDGTFKIVGGKNGKVFVHPFPKKRGSFVREMNPDVLDLKWAVTSTRPEFLADMNQIMERVGY